MKVRYTWRKDREWFRVPTVKRMPLACCDCGLVHRVAFRVTARGHVYMAAERDDAETKAVRRKYRRKLRRRRA